MGEENVTDAFHLLDAELADAGTAVDDTSSSIRSEVVRSSPPMPPLHPSALSLISVPADAWSARERAVVVDYPAARPPQFVLTEKQKPLHSFFK